MLILWIKVRQKFMVSPHPKSLSQGERNFEFPPLPMGEGARG